MAESKSTNYLKGKRFLLTQNSLMFISGSEVSTLELADYLKSSGAEVVVYTYYFAEPVKRYFLEKDIKVIDNDDEELKISDFDYIWVQHQILPIGIIKDFREGLQELNKKFVFYHMSSLDTVPFERPYIWDLEKKLSSKTLFNSLENRDKLAHYFSKEIKLDIYPNPVPVSFSKVKPAHNRKLNNILIVSNHPPEEVIRAKAVLKEKGYDVTSYGDSQDKTAIVTPEIISDYDLVVTIGKTVQYCLVAGIPVYVYDHFGGPGYLNEKNFDSAAYANFSGRYSSKKSAEKICDEIVHGFTKADEYHYSNREKFMEQFLMPNVFRRVIGNIKSVKFSKFDENYIDYLTDSHNLIREKMVSIFYLMGVEKEKNKIIAEKDRQIDKCIADKNEQLSVLLSSRVYRTGSAVTAPYRILKRAVQTILFRNGKS